jgi:hypothetical protein
MYQQVERLLKYVLTRGKLEGTVAEIKNIVEGWKTSTDRRTLGQLIKPLMEIHVQSSQGDSGLGGCVNDAAVSLTTTYQLEDDDRNKFQLQLEELVKDRNELIHHALSRYRLESVAGLNSGLDHLECQRRKIEPIRKQLEIFVIALREMLKNFPLEPEKSKSSD